MTASDTRYLDAARAAGRWIVASAVDAPDGPAWPVVVGEPDTSDPSLYGGEAGVAWFLSELAHTTGDGATAEAARAAAERCTYAQAETRFGLYTGLAGMAVAVDHTAERLDDDALRVAARQMVDQIAEASIEAGTGVEWPAWGNGRGPWQELYHGTAGIGLALLRLGRIDLAVRAGNRLVELAIDTPAGCWWRSRPDDAKPAPNIAHGTAGVAYFLATLALATRTNEYAATALAGAHHLLSIARTDDDTCAVHHHDVDGTDLYTLGYCSGPPGLGCLFIRLNQLTGDSSWFEWATRAARTITTSGVPRPLYPGFWDNVGQCCGSAGVADYFLGLHTITEDADHLAFACTMLDDILDRAVVDEQGMRWHNVEHRARDPRLPAQTGYMQGAAGIGAALLFGHQALDHEPLGPWLPGWPFG